MLDKNEGHSGIDGKVLQESRKRLQPSGGSAYRDDGERGHRQQIILMEQVIRHKNQEDCSVHEASLKKVSVLDSYNIKEIKSLPDSIKLQNIYRVPEGTRDSISIWIVDGYMVRKNIYPDFGFSGNDLAYHFIPSKEIWIDGQVSCEETEYSIALEMTERKLMSEGRSYSDAYEEAVQMVQNMRKAMEIRARAQLKVAVPDSLDRDSGLIDPDEK